jgi:hypothetical protein
MQRRAFVKLLTAVTAATYAAPLLANYDADCLESAGGYKSFGYYQGLLPDETRSANRTDGTYSSMPCISAADIEQGVEKTFSFWHGHGRQHMFTVTAEDFASLKAGDEIEIYTTVVDGHRHALRISPEEDCSLDA